LRVPIAMAAFYICSAILQYLLRAYPTYAERDMSTFTTGC